MSRTCTPTGANPTSTATESAAFHLALHPSWSPNGRLVFAEEGGQGEDASWSIVPLAPDGSDRRVEIDLPGADLAPIFSPDGERLVFSNDGPKPDG